MKLLNQDTNIEHNKRFEYNDNDFGNRFPFKNHEEEIIKEEEEFELENN